MKNSLARALGFALLSLPAQAWQSSFADSGQIKAVTVFSDRALVRRVARPEPGATQIVFKDLPARLVPQSLSASVQGGAIQGVALVPVVRDAKERWRDHPLQKELDQLEHAIAINDDRLSTNQEQLKLLGQFGQLSAEQSQRQIFSGAIDTKSWQSALEFLESRRNFYLMQMRSDRQESLRLKEKHKVLLERFARLKGASNPAPFEAAVSFAPDKDAEPQIALEYMVEGVSWSSYYDLRGSSESDAFQLVARARIHQASGEDWRAVELSLSSARPASGTAPPELKPWRVSASSLSERKGDAGKNQPDDFYDGSPNIENASSASSTATVQLQLPGKETILSNNAPHEILLKSSTLKGELTHIAVPATSEFVYLRARLQNSSGMPVFSGDMNIFLDGNFTGRSPLPYQVAQGEQFDVFLGADQRMRLKRTLIRGDVAGSGVFGNNVKIINTWQIEIANYSPRTRNISLYDQFPVPADPAIATEFIGADIPVERDANGILRWQIALKPAQKQKIEFSYALSLPAEVWQRLTREPQKPVRQMYDQNAPASPQMKRKYNLEQMLK